MPRTGGRRGASSSSPNIGPAIKKAGIAVAKTIPGAAIAKKYGPTVANAAKSGAKKVLGGYLNATQKAANYIDSKIPEKMKSVKPPVRIGGGRRRK